MHFIAPPPPKKLRVPTITLRQLVDAVILYLPTITNYAHSWERMTVEREDKLTCVSLNSRDLPGVVPTPVVRLYVHGKVAQSMTSKLWSEPFLITIYVQRTIRLVVEPRADKSIAIHEIISWEGDRPIWKTTDGTSQSGLVNQSAL